jgi:hypothetical protein
MNAVDLNEALRTYLGSGSNGGVAPYGMAERIRAKYGGMAEAVQASIDQVLDGLLDVPESQRFESLVTISMFVTERARTLRPDLHIDVCKAIGSYASYGHR